MDLSAPLYVGHSHLAAVARAAKENGVPALRVLDLKGDVDENTLTASVGGAPVISMIGGGDYNRLGLLAHEVPFDFFIEDEDYPDLPSSAGSVIPYAVIRDVMTARETKAFRLFEIFSAAAPGRVFHAESPPPVESNGFIAKRFNKAFPDREIGRNAISPPALRLKLWRLHSAITRDACRAFGIIFIPAPPAAVDRGYLRQDLISDASHGNAEYGRMVLDQIAAL